MNYFETRGLAVGYNGSALIHDIDIALGKGRILTLIGPNGSGKSTILKTLSRQLAAIRGAALLDGAGVFAMPQRELAKKQAVVKDIVRTLHGREILVLASGIATKEDEDFLVSAGIDLTQFE